MIYKPGLLTQTCNDNTQEVMKERYWVWGQPGLHGKFKSRLGYIARSYLKETRAATVVVGRALTYYVQCSGFDSPALKKRESFTIIKYMWYFYDVHYICHLFYVKVISFNVSITHFPHQIDLVFTCCCNTWFYESHAFIIVSFLT
jgi:hypothetical protein